MFKSTLITVRELMYAVVCADVSTQHMNVRMYTCVYVTAHADKEVYTPQCSVWCGLLWCVSMIHVTVS